MMYPPYCQIKIKYFLLLFLQVIFATDDWFAPPANLLKVQHTLIHLLGLGQHTMITTANMNKSTLLSGDKEDQTHRKII